MSARGVFITGTDTNVGKTAFSALLVSRLKKERRPVRYFKPVQTDTDSDTKTVTRLSKLNQEEILPPTYQFPEPMAPHRAAILHDQEIDVDRIRADFIKILRASDDFFVVEGAGGLLVPINAKQTMRDLALALDLPLVIIASTRLGTINHTLLTVEAARTAGCRLLGLVLNGKEDPGLADLLMELTDLPLLAEVRPMAKLNTKSISELADAVLADSALNRILSQEGRG